MSDSPPDRSDPDPWGASYLLEQASWVRQIARSMLRDEEDVRDLTQDVMAEALASNVPDQGPSLRAWLRTVTRRLAIRRYRRKNLEHAFLEREGEERASAVDTLLAEKADDALRLHEELVKALRDLDPADRTLLVQRHVDGISPAELARRADVSPIVMRKRLSRALERLRTGLGRRLGPDEHDRVQADRARRALVVLATPLPAIPYGAPAPATPSTALLPATLIPPTLITMGLQKLTLVTAAVLALGGIAFFQLRATEVGVDPVPVNEAPATDVAQLTLPEAQPGTGRDAVLLSPDAEDPVAASDVEVPEESAYVEFRGPDGVPRADAFGAWIDAGDTLHPLVVGGDARCAVPAGIALQIVASAPGSLPVNRRCAALEAGAVESIELLARPRVRMRVTVDGAPPEERIRFTLNAGGVALAGGVYGMGLDVREELDRMGLIQRIAPVETDLEGAIDVELPARMERLNLGIPEGFLVNTVNGESAVNAKDVIGVPTGPEVTTVDLRALPRVFGRMVWEDSGAPYVGDGMGVRTFAESASGGEGGETVEEFFGFQTNTHGRFSIGMHEILGTPREAADGTQSFVFDIGERPAFTVGLEARDHGAVAQDRHTFKVDPLSHRQNLGEIQVRRLPHLRVRIVGERGAGTEPIVAGVASSVQAVTTDREGLAEVSLGPEGWIDVLSPGYEFVRVTPPPGPAGAPSSEASEVWTVSLAKAPSLRVRMPPSLASTDPKLQPSITLRYTDSPFGSFSDPAAPRPELSQALYRAVFGLRHEQQRAIGKSSIEFYPSDGGLVTISGLRDGASVSVEWTDFIGGVFASEPLQFEGDGEEIRCPRDVEPAFLEATMVGPDGALAPGGFIMLKGANRRTSAIYFESATLFLGPLAGATCDLKIFSHTGSRFENKEIPLAPGLNSIDVQLGSE
ncbi:RNA polymerase sigma factor [Planctomycetes bacterium Poly30]|uniref:RNA polymerase sigma factor n=1 Tax=Saltatorellus ferox TaxID=2528018 RepID=A0A518EKI2_9BACT|nr:RNA polymerase sigma factor [Planctomycetes bacterium Poly30]